MPSRPPPRPHRLPGRPAARTPQPPAADTPAEPTTQPTSDGPLIERFELLRESLEGRPGGEALPAPMLDGFLCGVLLQPRAVPLSRWWPAALDPDDQGANGSLPPALAETLEGMRRIAIDRHATLEAAIANRQWFDPWVIDEGVVGAEEVAGADGESQDDDDDSLDDPSLESMPDSVRESVYPWVAGFAHAMACFQDLLELADPAAAEPQALLCQFLDADDLEDADALLELIETLEPPTELGDAVEMLVRATLLLADITRPVPLAAGSAGTPGSAARGPRAGAPHRGGPPAGGRRPKPVRR